MGRHWAIAIFLSVALVGGAIAARTISSGPDAPRLPLEQTTWPRCATAAPEPPDQGKRTLVLHDAEGEFRDLANVHATLTADLASHFGESDVVEIDEYDGAEGYDAIVYVGRNYDEPLPETFIDDVLSGDWPVLWIGENLWQLPLAPKGDIPVRWIGELEEIHAVRYGGQVLTVPVGLRVPLVEAEGDDVEVLATADGSDGPVPYALSADHLLWVAEAPFDIAVGSDRYLVLADLLIELLQPRAPERHRATVRLEDVGPRTDPDQLRAAIDLLASRDIPFSMAVYPVYVGALDEGDGEVRMHLREAPEVVHAIAHGLGRGGTLVAHGYTHQHARTINPLSGRSADDFEFFLAHFEDGELIYDRPVPEDSPAWVRGRFARMVTDLTDLGLPEPDIFEFPHYMASEDAYAVAAEEFAARYDNTHVFSDSWDRSGPASPHLFSLAAPYLIRDSYGSVVIPETLGFIDATADPGEPGSVEMVLEGARDQLVVRDGQIGFFFHSFLGTERLRAVVDGIAELGYEFIAPCSS